MLLAGRHLLSLDWPSLPGGKYYWQHCFWVDSADFPNDAQMFLQTAVHRGLLYTSQVSFYGTTFYYPGTDTVYARQTYITIGHGGQPAQTNPNLLICARWRMFGEDGSYSYHLHRQPVGDTYIEDGGWSTLGFSQSSIRMNTFIGQHKYRTHTGSLIDTGYVGSRPVMWQLRHGTKRRERRGWL